jgi:Subtilase family
MPRLRHLLIQGTAQPQPYVYAKPVRGKPFPTPPRDAPAIHGERLAAALRGAVADLNQHPEPAAQGVEFVPITLRSDPGFKLLLDSLDNNTVQLVNVRSEPDGSQKATIHLPKDKVPAFLRKFDAYAHKLTQWGKPQNQSLAESIKELRLAMLRNGDYWMDSGPMPAPDDEFWWEVWLLRDVSDIALPDGGTVPVETAFREEAARVRIRVSDQQVRFPEYVVVLAYTSLDRLSECTGLLRYLAEVRRANIVPTEFLDLTPAGQQEFSHAMLERTTFAAPTAPAVCILDCGVNRGHPLLEHALPEAHNLAWRNDWTSADRHGHGTGMAGLALYGPQLGELLLAADRPVLLRHRLEAVKILPDVGRNNPPDYGPITLGSVAKIEIEAPNAPRVLCMAITASDKDQSQPTLWSSSIDQMCSGAHDDYRRLMFVSAGNYRGEVTVPGYPSANHTASVQDPAQAWNVVTVGAYTNKVMIDDRDLRNHTPLAPQGGLCPTSTTSCGWRSREWPFKPDIVMEGGNYAYDPSHEVTDVADLSLLTTILSPDNALFSTMRDTSAATALASRYAALIQVEYPDYWPETIRGLLIHSARWTQRMIEEFPHEARHDRLRCYGYGVPNLPIARECAANRATMIIQDSLQPFRWDEGKKDTATNDMHEHTLPWPLEFLRDLGATQLRMKVTLSYFIEPNPGRRGWNSHHRYQSHGLRFDVRRPRESPTQFRQRLTKDAWENDLPPGGTVPDNRAWTLGDDLRKKGSIHSDVWSGSAADLAASGVIAVYPITGWWRTSPKQRHYDKSARYSLIVTIDSDENIDIYSEIQTVIANRADITVTA